MTSASTTRKPETFSHDNFDLPDGPERPEAVADPDDTALDNTALDDTALDDTSLDNTSLDNTSLDNTAPESTETTEAPVEASGTKPGWLGALTGNRTGGVAPFVAPPGRLARLRNRQTWGRRGFVAVSPGRPKRRHRILPRTVIGISTMLMCVGIGAAFSGAAFYAYYDDRLAENEREIATFVDGFDTQFQDAAGALDRIREESIEQVRTEMAPLGDWAEDANGVVGLPASIGGSVWMVETRTEDGRSSLGTAFAVTGHNGGTALVTSLSVVRASTVGSGPGITLVKGDQRFAATLRTWDEANDLALVVTDAEIPHLDMASARRQSEALGRPVFAMSGLGGQGATASPGVLLDLSGLGLQHTAAIGSVFAGGPIVGGDGAVIGIASLSYRPVGVDMGEVGQAPSSDALCEVILRCAEVEGDDTIIDLSLAPEAAAEIGVEEDQADG